MENYKYFLGRILVLCLLLVFSFTSTASAIVYGAAGYESHGDFEDDPWEIDSAATLRKFRDDFNQTLRSDKMPPGKYIKLTADIDLTSDTEWGGIGFSNAFDMTFNGNGHTIKLRISRNGWTNVGLFGKVQDGTIKNLNVTGIVKGYNAGKYDAVRVGGIVAQLIGGIIENCTFDGTIDGKGGFQETKIGGIVGVAGGNKVIIKNCKVGAFSNTSISGGTGYFGTYVGGIIGYFDNASNSIVSNNFVKAKVNADDQYSSDAHSGLIYGEKKNSGSTVSDNEEIDPDNNTLPEIAISTSSLANGYVNIDYSANLEADINGLKWSWAGNTPEETGLKLDSLTGLISGKPTTRGTYLFTVTAKKDGYISKTVSLKLTIFSESEKAVQITTTSLPSGIKGNSYVARLQASEAGVTWSWTGNTPEAAGLTLNSSTGAITGKPTVANNYTFSVIASKTGYISASKTFTIVITGLPEFAITTTSLENAEVGEYYTAFLDAEEAGVTWSWTGNTPETVGLTLDSSGGYIYGNPTSGGKYTFTLTASKSGYADATIVLTLLIMGDGLAINGTNFPDTNFRSYVSSQSIDKDGDGYLSDSEIASVKTIDVSNKNISNFKGIELFTNLESLNCSGNNLATLDISKNIKLNFLDCSSNLLTALDISKNIALEFLDCSDNKITELNTSNNKALENIHCYGNQLSNLDVSQNTNLEYLACQDNKLTKLDVSKNTKLVGLYCSDNLLTELILGSNSVLDEVDCQNNSSLKRLDIKGCPNLSSGNFSHDAGLIIISDQGTSTPEAGDDIPIPEFKTHQPILEGQILVNFYVDMPDVNGGYYNDSYVSFKVLNDTMYNEPQDFDLNFMNASRTYYGFQCALTSIQMADPVFATLHYGNNNDLTVTHEWSLREYLDKFYNNDASPEKLKNLLAAMKDYCHYAQIALAETNGWTLGVDHVAMECVNDYTNNDLEEAKQVSSNYKIVRNTGNSGIQTVSFNLELDSDTTLNVYLRPKSDYAGSVTAFARGVIGMENDGKNIAEKQSDGRYKITINGIAAHQLADKNTIMVVTDSDTFYVEVSAFSYIDMVFTSTNAVLGSTNMKNAVTSLYKYYKTNMEYREFMSQ